MSPFHYIPLSHHLHKAAIIVEFSHFHASKGFFDKVAVGIDQKIVKVLSMREQKAIVGRGLQVYRVVDKLIFYNVVRIKLLYNFNDVFGYDIVVLEVLQSYDSDLLDWISKLNTHLLNLFSMKLMTDGHTPFENGVL